MINDYSFTILSWGGSTFFSSQNCLKTLKEFHFGMSSELVYVLYLITLQLHLIFNEKKKKFPARSTTLFIRLGSGWFLVVSKNEIHPQSWKIYVTEAPEEMWLELRRTQEEFQIHFGTFDTFWYWKKKNSSLVISQSNHIHFHILFSSIVSEMKLWSEWSIPSALIKELCSI